MSTPIEPTYKCRKCGSIWPFAETFKVDVNTLKCALFTCGGICDPHGWTSATSAPPRDTFTFWTDPEKKLPPCTGQYLMRLHKVGNEAQKYIIVEALETGFCYDNEDGQMADPSEWQAWLDFRDLEKLITNENLSLKMGVEQAEANVKLKQQIEALLSEREQWKLSSVCRAQAQRIAELEAQLLTRTVDQLQGKSPDPTAIPLRPALQRIFTLAGQGLTQKEIAEACGTTAGTIHSYLRRIRARRGYKNTRALVLAAVKEVMMQQKPTQEQP